MSETALNSFVNGVAAYLVNSILPRIVEGLEAKSIFTTVEELTEMIKLPSTNHVPLAASAPAMAFGGAVPPLSQAATGKKVAASSTILANPVAGRCAYQFKRGEHKGLYCGKNVALGNNFCNNCMKTRSKAATEGALNSTAPGAAPNMGAPGFTAPQPTENQSGALSVVPFDESRGLFRDPVHNFIVRQVTPGSIAVIGKRQESDNSIIPLTPQDKVIAREIGLVIPEQTPSMPTIGTIPSMPNTHA